VRFERTRDLDQLKHLDPIAEGIFGIRVPRPFAARDCVSCVSARIEERIEAAHTECGMGLFCRAKIGFDAQMHLQCAVSD